MITSSRPLADLSAEEKRALIARLLREKARQPKSFPLSFAQQRLWFLDQLNAGMSAYNMPSAMHLTGALRLAALSRALTAIVRRHQVLRTTFPSLDGEPFQRIGPMREATLPLIDLRGLPAAEREPQARRVARDEAVEPFDLSHGPLLRATLLRLADDEHVLLLTAHHIVFDDWSRDVFLHELTTLYAAFAAGQPSPLPPLPIQYADYAMWQREQLQGSGVRDQGSGDRGQGIGVRETRRQGSKEIRPDAETQPPSPIPHPPSPIQAQLAYWKRQLAEAPAVLELPTDHPRPPVQTYDGAEYSFTLPASLRAALKALSQREGATLFMTLLAAFEVLLARYTGQTAIVVGSPIAGRTRTELEPLIGFFVNTLALHTDLSGSPTFRELLGRVRETCLGAYAHQELPFEKLIEELRIARDMSHMPLFQVMFNLRTASPEAIGFPGLALDEWEDDGVTAKLDLTLLMLETEQQLIGAIEYNTNLFDADMIARMASHLQTLLNGIVADPDRRFSELPLLTEAEWQHIAVYNDTTTSYRRDVRLHQLFEAQAMRVPDAVALVFDSPGVRGQGSGVRETRSQESGVRSQESEFLASNPQHPSPGTLHPAPSTRHPAPGTQHLTYHELNRRANQVARYLRSLGVGPEVLVGLCLERSLDMLVGLLGILKAGGAYVPLDPAYPAQRLAFMLEDSQAAVLITTTDHRPATTSDDRSTYGHDISCPNDDQRRSATTDLRSQSKIQNPKSKIVHLDADWPLIARFGSENLSSAVTADNPAYVIYTSGSTGKPKGVQIAHRSAINFLHSMRQRPGLTDRDTLLSVTTLSFDIAALELFLPLTTGARLVLASRDVAADAVRLAAALDTSGATIMQATPATWHALLDAGWPGSPALTILCGGEALPRELADRLRSSGRALWNMYGPTETTIWSSIGPVAQGPVSLGTPIANTQIYLLTAAMQPVPVGIPGELYIGGAGLARGYLNRPDLTAERFVPNPFTQGMGDGEWGMEDASPSPIPHPPSPGTRLYKTGDLARYRPDGMIEYLGRADQQVKLRGFRIETGEIEAALRQHPAVREAVVLAREDVAGDRRLVAYIVPKIGDRGLKIEDSGSDAPDPLSSILYPLSSELRTFLRERLPDYMLPSTFVTLDALPLTPNGKIDRRALPAPGTARPELEAAFVAPRTGVERRLARIWEDLLGISPIGVTDNFFDLGGHSLLAVRLMAQIQKQLGRSLPLATLFQGATIEHLAGLVHQQGDDAPWSPLVAIQPGGSKRPFFGVHPIGGNVLCYADLARALGPDQPFYGLQAVELAEVGDQELRIEDMAARYVEALRSVQPEGPYMLGGWSFGGFVAFEMAQQLRRQGHAVGLLALLDTRAPTSLGKANTITDAMVLAVLVKEQALALGATLPIAIDDLQQRDPQEQLSYVLEQVKRAGLDFETELEWVQRFLLGYRARERAMRAYKPQVYPGRVTLFRSTEQDSEIARIQALTGADFSSPDYGWQAFSSEPVEVLALAGYHNTLIVGANADAAAQHLNACFEQVRATLTPAANAAPPLPLWERG